MIVSGVRGRLVRWARLKMRSTPVLGILSCACAVAGIGAWAGYARNAGAWSHSDGTRRACGSRSLRRPRRLVQSGPNALGRIRRRPGLVRLDQEGNLLGLDQWASGVGFFLGAVALLLMLLIV